MMSSSSYWEETFKNLRSSHSKDIAELDYLDLASQPKVTNKDLSYNLRILQYRVDLGQKVIFTAIRQSQELTLQDIKGDQKKIQQSIQACKNVVIKQQQQIEDLSKGQAVIHQEVLRLKEALRNQKPLTKKDVEELVVTISQQPKFIEKQTEALTEHLAQEVAEVQKLIKRLEKVLMGE